MITSSEFRQFARECAKWAVETESDEDGTSFLVLANDWTFAATATESVEKREVVG